MTPALHVEAAALAHGLGIVDHALVVQFRAGFALALAGKVPCNMAWMRQHYPAEARAAEAGYRAGIEKMGRVG